MRVDRRIAASLAAVVISSVGCTVSSDSHHATRATAAVTLRQHPHYAANANLTTAGRYAPRVLQYDLADITSSSVMSELPRGVSALAFIGRCDGATPAFRAAIRSFPRTSRVWGFYLMDEPHSDSCSPARLRAEADWLATHRPRQKSFVVLDNLSSSMHPTFVGGYTPANTHVDYFGIDPYPCRTELQGCDLTMIDRYVHAAIAAGLPRQRLVPVYQAFGGGKYVDDGGGHYALPTPAQAHAIICRWQRVLPNPVFDFTYSWGSQEKDHALSTASAALRNVFARHNAGDLSCPPAPNRS